MVTLVNDHMAIVRNKIFRRSLALDALNHSNIDQAGSFVFPSTELPNVLNRQRQVCR